MRSAEEYKSAMIAAAGKNPMRADYPPDWDAGSIEDEYVEKRSEEIYQGMMDDPEEMAEMLWSGFGGDNGKELMLDLCKELIALKRCVTSLVPVSIKVKLSLDSMMDEYSIDIAKREIENA